MSEGRVPLINLRMTQGRFSSRSRANIWMSNRQHFETALPSTPFCQKPSEYRSKTYALNLAIQKFKEFLQV